LNEQNILGLLQMLYTPTMGKVVGKHQGAHFTVGQRKGLNVGGTTDPLFIIGTNVENQYNLYGFK
jgi:tRNA-specific 2-thiouridylase